MYMRRNEGVSFGYGGVIKENGRGDWWNPKILILSISLNIWQDICFSCYVDASYHFLQTYSAKNPAKIPCFYDFVEKNWFLLIFMCIFNSSNFLRSRWLYNITVTSYEVQWYSFWYQWIEEGHTYTLVGNIGVSVILYGKSREELQQPPFGGQVTKIPQEDKD